MIKSDSWRPTKDFLAANVAPKNLYKYLCDLGPYGCFDCKAQCEYGKRWMNERQGLDREEDLLDRGKRK